MNHAVSFLPIVIMLIIIVVGIFVIIRVNRMIVAKAGYWMFGAYVIVLLLSVGVYYLIPVSTEERLEAPKSGYNQYYFSDVFIGEKPVESINDYLFEEWEFAYDEDTINIGHQGDLNNSINIAVERTDGDTIKAAFYQTPVYVSGMELTEYIKPVDLQLSRDGLIIKLPTTVQLDLTTFSKEFPLKQFTASANQDWYDKFHDLHWGEQLLYLQVPREIEISSEMDVYIEYVNE